ncbi:hypothetical protein E2R55_15850 [Vibrio vulnificus]|nr:hypothetical protein E2R55_15850 [Vibrio vulnificus]
MKDANFALFKAELEENYENGIHDKLTGVERILTFEALDIKNKQIEVVQSLAK